MKTHILTLFLLISGTIIAQESFWGDLSELHQAPEMRWLDDTSAIRSLLFKNKVFEGKTTEVFAFYATPGTISGDPSKDKNLPAVVLLHGGGGTAFPNWVLKWAKRGYAAIAIDQSGMQPAAPNYDFEKGKIINYKNKRQRLENGGPLADSTYKFTMSGGDLSDDWQQHTVAAAMRAHSLIRSFPEVNAERTAVTGISWGGYMTCLVASVDHRFKAAVPVYGCGFLYEGESVQKQLIDKQPADTYDFWIKHYDPSVWLPQCTSPILFVNGTNDRHYPLDSYMKSYNVVNIEKQIRIEVNMKHGHWQGWRPEEIGAFIDHHLLGTPPLPEIKSPTLKKGKAKVKFASELPIKKGELHYTTEVGPLLKRQWQTVPASIEGTALTAEVPEDATIWMFSVTDERGLMVSSTVQFK